MQAFGHLPFKVTSADTRRLLQVRATISDELFSKMQQQEEK